MATIVWTKVKDLFFLPSTMFIEITDLNHTGRDVSFHNIRGDNMVFCRGQENNCDMDSQHHHHLISNYNKSKEAGSDCSTGKMTSL